MRADRQPGWGERRSAERTDREVRRIGWTVGAVIALAIGVPFMTGFVEGFSGTGPGTVPEWLIAVVTVGWAVAVLVAGRQAWRGMDEVQRSVALRVMAAIGCGATILFPLFANAGPALGIEDAGDLPWLVAMMLGLGALVTARVRA